MTDAVEFVPLECSVFFSFLRIRCGVPPAFGPLQSVTLLRNGISDTPERQSVSVTQLADRETGSASSEFALEALIDRACFPADYALRIAGQHRASTLTCTDLVEREKALYAQTMMVQFRGLVEAWLCDHPGQRPALLDVGGRARSGYRYARIFGDCDVTTADIVPDDSVDVVTDIHRMSHDLGTSRFDLAICVSVFEHLLMPWKAAIEINKVLKPGGIVMIHTHQTVGMHDLPWDYYRFSDESWKGLFNKPTGFRIEFTLMSSFQRIVPMHHYAATADFESAGGFLESSMIARKISNTELSWPVELSTIIETIYPQ